MPFLKDYPQIKLVQEIARQKKVDVHLVGGFLRDFVLGTHKMDFDFAVSKDALKLAKSFARKSRGAYICLDEERGCARVAQKTGAEIATYDFADFRNKTFEGDLKARDFTINTLSVDINALSAKDEIADVIKDVKRARRDIKDKRIKMASVNAFKDDPLRMLRAFSLKALLGFRIELKTLNKIRKSKDLIRDVSYERIREELFKILATEDAAKILKEMDRAGLLEKVMPQVSVMEDCKQGTYHHLDVWPHSLETVVQLEKLFKKIKGKEDFDNYLSEDLGGGRSRAALMKLAALLHDIGKPDTRKRENGRLTFHGHERVGKDIVRSISKMLKVSTRERFILEKMVLWHLRPGYMSNFKKPSERMIFRYFRDTEDEAVSILLISMADQKATCGPLTTQKDQKHHKTICKDLIERYFKKQKEEPFVRLIDGGDIIKRLKLKPSPLFGKILAEVEEKQALGKIKTKREALALAKEIAAK